MDAAALLGHSLEVHYANYLPSSERRARSAASALGAALAGPCGLCVRFRLRTPAWPGPKCP